MTKIHTRLSYVWLHLLTLFLLLLSGMLSPSVADEFSFLYHAKVLPDGSVEKGELDIEAKPGKEIKVRVMHGPSGKWEIKAISLKELAQIQIAGFSELHFAVSTKNALIITRQTGKDIEVLKSKSGNVTIKQGDNYKELLKEKVTFVKGVRQPDGRIRVEEKF